MYIASASTTVKFHDFPNGNIIYNYQPGTKIDGPIRSISWSKDGNWLSLVPHSGLTEIISVRDQLKLLYTIYDVDEPSCASFQNSTKKCIALGTKSGQVLVYDIKSRKVHKRFPRTTSQISHVAFVAKDTHLIAGSANGDVLLYNHSANTLSSTFRIPKSDSVSALQPNATKRNLILGGSNEGVVVLWDTNVNKSIFFVEAHKAPITSVTFSPVNSELILSTGLDRQFSFYDTISKKCIASVPVENNIISADFTRDAINFIMASQSGKIYIYDSRRIQEPMYSFDAHNSTIKHLLIQKTGEPEVSFNTSNTESMKHKSPKSAITKENGDSFGLCIDVSPNVAGENVVSPVSVGGDAGDSFMAAMGLDGSTTEVSKQERSLGITEEIKKWMDSKVCFNETPFSSNTEAPTAMRPARLLQDKLSVSSAASKQTSSTPKYLSEMVPPISPIISSSQLANQTGIKVEDISIAVKDTVKSELQEFLEKMKKDIQYELKSSAAQMRRVCLDSQMGVTKELLNIQENIRYLREMMASDYPLSDHCLLEENLRLKKRIAELEEELNARNGNHNGV